MTHARPAPIRAPGPRRRRWPAGLSLDAPGLCSGKPGAGRNACRSRPESRAVIPWLTLLAFRSRPPQLPARRRSTTGSWLFLHSGNHACPGVAQVAGTILTLPGSAHRHALLTMYAITKRPWSLSSLSPYYTQLHGRCSSTDSQAPGSPAAQSKHRRSRAAHHAQWSTSVSTTCIQTAGLLAPSLFPAADPAGCGFCDNLSACSTIFPGEQEQGATRPLPYLCSSAYDHADRSKARARDLLVCTGAPARRFRERACLRHATRGSFFPPGAPGQADRALPSVSKPGKQLTHQIDPQSSLWPSPRPSAFCCLISPVCCSHHRSVPACCSPAAAPPQGATKHTVDVLERSRQAPGLSGAEHRRVRKGRELPCSLWIAAPGDDHQV